MGRGVTKIKICCYASSCPEYNKKVYGCIYSNVGCRIARERKNGFFIIPGRESKKEE